MVVMPGYLHSMMIVWRRCGIVRCLVEAVKESNPIACADLTRFETRLGTSVFFLLVQYNRLCTAAFVVSYSTPTRVEYSWQLNGFYRVRRLGVRYSCEGTSTPKLQTTTIEQHESRCIASRLHLWVKWHAPILKRHLSRRPRDIQTPPRCAPHLSRYEEGST